jgi:hypothetical protein
MPARLLISGTRRHCTISTDSRSSNSVNVTSTARLIGPARSVRTSCTAYVGGAAIGGDRRGQAGGFGGGRRNQQIDEKTLTQVAEITGGRYFKAENSAALTDVLLDLPSSISLQRKDLEVTVWFALAGAVLVLVATGLTHWWSRTRPFPTPPVKGPLSPAARGPG